MATTTKTYVTDDLTGEDNAKTHTIAFDGRTYEVDLTDESWDNLIDNELHRLIAVARPTKGHNTAKAKGAGKRGDLARIRAWAYANGHHINARGRIAQSVITAYDNANPAGGN